MINDIKVAFAFLTRIPINHSPEVRIHKSAAWFPLVGFITGSLSGGTYYLLSQVLPSLPAAVFAVLVSTLITGTFHLDGLADIFDGLVGGWNIEDRLKILKDSRHGTYGVVAIVIQIILQISLIASLNSKDGALALIAAHTIAKVIPVILMLIPAVSTHQGMGASTAREVRFPQVSLNIFIAAIFTIPFCGYYFFTILLALVIPLFIFSKWVINKIGGMLGDAFGAGEQIAETVILLFFVLNFSIYGVILWNF